MAESTRKPGDGLPSVKASRNAQATGAANAERLIPGSTYTAKVQGRQDDGTYTVTTIDPQQDLTGVQLALPVMGGLFGMNIRCNLPAQTSVKIAYGSPSFIICVLPDNNADWLNAQSRSAIWGPKTGADQEGASLDNFSTQADDLLEGEVEMSNMFGIALEFLTTLIRMKASDRAVVECHLINDMVRIISAQYRHISGMGEELIFDHGRPTLERNWSMYRHEVLGLDKEKTPFAEMNGDEVDRDKLEARRITGIGRMRLKEFIGFAGDFIHSFVSDPPKAIVSLGQGSAGAGKSWLHRNSDGSVIIQSVADIRIERTCRIPVAVRTEHHEDPDVTKAREYDNLEKDFLKLPAALSSGADLYQTAYHIRSYSRWLGRYHSFARMLQMPEYYVSSEAAAPVPDWRNREADREATNGRALYPDGESTTLYYDAYACITIMRDGSIVLYDGYGASIVMSNGNLQLSAPRHIDVEAAGDLRLKAGGSILMKARRNIELSATLGGLVLHSCTWLKMLCERGTLWLRSNAVTDKDAPDPTAAAPGMPLPEVAGRMSGTAHGAAILVEAAEGHAVYRSQMGVAFAIDGSPIDANDRRYNMTVSTEGDLDLRGKRRVDLRSSGQTRIAGESVLIAALSFLTNAAEFILGRNLASPDVIIRNKMLWCRRLFSDDIAGGRITGPERGPRVAVPDAQPDQQLKQHVNHIDVFPNNVIPAAPIGASTAQVNAMTAASSLVSSSPVLPWQSSSDGPLWSFPPVEEYVWDNREKTGGGIPETLTQQFLRLDALTSPNDQWGGAGYSSWSLNTTVSGKRIRASGGFGSHEIVYRASDEGENLHIPSESLPSAFSNVKIEWTPVSDASIKVLKRESEQTP